MCLCLSQTHSSFRGTAACARAQSDLAEASATMSFMEWGFACCSMYWAVAAAFPAQTAAD